MDELKDSNRCTPVPFTPYGLMSATAREGGKRRGGEGMELEVRRRRRKEGRGKGWKKGQRGYDREKDNVTQRKK